MRNALATSIALLPDRARPVHGSVHTDRDSTDVYCGRCPSWLPVGRDDYGFRVPPYEWLRAHERQVHATPIYCCEDCPSQWVLDSDGPARHAFTNPSHRVRIREEA
jgi:hypothetical protein